MLRERVNTNCKWTVGSHATLDDDALFAEDLAIRYADAHRGHRSGHYKGPADYEQAREQCMAQLFDAVAREHRVTPSQVREALTHRPTLLDAGVIASFFLIYGFAAHAIVAWISRRFPFERTWAIVVAALVASVPVGMAGWLVGGLWSSIVDMLWIGNAHGSYRGSRVPWNQHQAGALGACVLVFWIAAALGHRRLPRQ